MALEGVDRLRSRENNYSILLRYMMARFIFFLRWIQVLNLPKMFTDQLRRDKLS